MADFYLDVSAVGNEYQAYADTPASWAVPQDGNGKAGPGHSAAVPVAEVAFAAVPTSGTISVYGVSVTLTGVLSAASTSAAATALASSINATTAATSAAVCRQLLPLNRFVFARVKPGDSSTVQIMCRIAGADLNGPANTSAQVVNTFNNAAMSSPVNFTGGADGPWAYFVNNAAVFGKAQFTYGMLVALAPSPALPAVSDIINVRTRRGGSNLSVSASSATAITLTTPAELSFVFDNGSVWVGDNGQLTLAVSNTGGAVTSVIRPLNGAANIRRVLRLIAKSKYGFRVTYTASTAGSSLLVGGNTDGSTLLFRRVVFSDSGANGRIYLFHFTGSNGWLNGVASECLLDFKSDHAATVIGLFNGASKYKYLNCEFQFSGLSADATSLVSFTGDCQSAQEIEIRHCKAVVVGGAWLVANAVSGTNLPANRFFRIVCDDVSGLRAPSFVWNAAFTASNVTFINLTSGYWQSRDGDKPFRYSTPLFTTDWIDDGTYPTAGETLPSGNEWSVRSVWQEGARIEEPQTVFTAYSFYRGAAGLKTLTLELLVPASGAPTRDNIEIIFSYTDSSGVVRNESSGAVLENAIAGSGTALETSSKTWTMNGLTGYVARKISIATEFQVANSSDVSAAVQFVSPPSVSTPIFINPAVDVADA